MHIARSKRKSKTAAISSAPDTAERILDAAEMLFAKHGFDAVSMNAIALRAGVSKANVFHHFGAKNTLYIAVLKRMYGRASDSLGSLANDAQPLGERLTHYAKTHLTTILQHRHITRLILRELMQDNNRHNEELAQQVFGEDFSRFVKALRESQLTGELRTDVDPALVAVIIKAANVFFFQSQEILKHFSQVDFAQDPTLYSRKVVDLLLQGIGKTTT